jgi:hypothetical protein
MPGNIPYRNLIFIPVFFSFYLLLKAIGSPDLALTSFTGRPVSSATAEGVDIGARVALFYKGLLFLVFLLIALTKMTLIAQRFIPREEMSLLNGLSLAAFCLLFYRLLGAEIRPSLHVIFGLMAMVGVGSILHQVRKRDTINYKVALLWSAMIATAFFFLQWQAAKFFSMQKFLSLPVTLLIFGSLLYLASTNRFTINYRILKATFPFVLLPLLSFGSMEDSMIFNQHNIFISPVVFYLTGLAILALWSFYSYRKYKGIHSGIPHDIRLFRTWMPWLLCGLFCMAFYSPIVHAEIDIFESANNILPLQQWYNFGRIPLIDTFNAHAIADFSPGWLYSIFNGHDPMGYFVYRFMVQVIVLISVYVLIYKMSGDGFLAIWLTLAYPYIDHLIPSYFNLVPVAVIAFIRLYEKQTTGRYLFYFLSILFMILWRIDLGLAVLISGTLSLFFLIFFVPTFETNKHALRRALMYSTGIGILIFLFVWIKSGSHIFISIKDVLAYLSSSQSYGRLELTTQLNLEYFSLYFILPAVVLLIVAVTIYNVRTAHFTGNGVLAALAIVFLAIFYFTNFQRGLIRHTLYEQWNNALTSYGFFIISGYILILIHKQSYESRFLIFFIVSTLLIANYVYQQPDLKTNNNYYTLSDKIYNSGFIYSAKEKLNRIIEDPAVARAYKEFKEFMDKNYPNGTFVDFSNTPMMYYYANRQVPGYFLQPPHTAHNDYLQKRFIEDLKKYDVPVLVFSNAPGNFWDNLDGIPNAMRHYLIADYLYKNYSPSFIIGDHSVWTKNDLPYPNENRLTNVWFDSLLWNGKKYMSQDIYLNTIHTKGKLFAIWHFNARKNSETKFYYKFTNGQNQIEHSKTIKFIEGLNDIQIILDNVPVNEKIISVRYENDNNSEIEYSSITLRESEYILDYISRMPVFYSLKWIPFIWGQYDAEKFEKSKKSSEIISNVPILISKNIKKSFINDKLVYNTSVNSFKLNIRNLSGKIATIKIDYGFFGSYFIGSMKTPAFNEANGGAEFYIQSDSIPHDYTIRIGSQFNWRSRRNNLITITSSENCELKSAEIIEGD